MTPNPNPSYAVFDMDTRRIIVKELRLGDAERLADLLRALEAWLDGATEGPS